MLRTVLASLVGAIAAAMIAWSLGGTRGGGVLTGYLLAAGVCGLGFMYQRHTLMFRPTHSFLALGVSFMAKFLVLLMGGMAFRYLEPAALRADWKCFIVAYAAAVCLLMPFGAWDMLVGMRQAKAQREKASIDLLTPSEA